VIPNGTAQGWVCSIHELISSTCGFSNPCLITIDALNTPTNLKEYLLGFEIF
jgi:hypothetical protein